MGNIMIILNRLNDSNSASVAPKLDDRPRRSAICVGIILLKVLHHTLPHGRVNSSGSSSCLSSLSLT